jgi:uncharacterized membrane protein YphA (DoxX/SURF4 family)
MTELRRLFDTGVRLTLGLTFVYASYHKIMEPAEFARIIYGYYIFPGFSINLLAILVPWLELTAGLALISGILPRPGLFIINAMLLGFILAIGFNLARGHEFDCGCFTFSEPQHVSSAAWLLVRDAAMLAGGVYLWPRMSARGSHRRSVLSRRG